MQIRLGTRQDEAIIKTIVSQALNESGLVNEDDSDLTDIDSHYFWHDGIFVVAEDDGTIVGLGGGRKRKDSEDELEIARLFVIPSRRSKGVGQSLIDTIANFAHHSGYRRMVAYPDQQGLGLKEPLYGFGTDPDTPSRWIREVPPADWLGPEQPSARSNPKSSATPPKGSGR